MVIQNKVTQNFEWNFVFSGLGNEKIIEALIRNNKTNVNAIDRDGHTALDAVNTATEGKSKNIRLHSKRNTN